MIITFPETLQLAKQSWGQARMDIQFESVFSAQSAEISAPLWTLLMTPLSQLEHESGEWEALLLKMKGRANQLAVWNLGRSVPVGTMRGTMTLSGAHAQGATTLNISATGQGGKTLVYGDMLGLGSGITQQVVKVVEPATADVNGNITVIVESFLRNAFIDGTAVTWDKPKALFRRRSSETRMDYANYLVDGLALDLIEDWNP
jgi:hypothetical protein